MNFLGKNIRHLRKQSAKTQSEIASLLKKGQTTIGNWENGVSEPNLEELILLSNYFDIPLDTLVMTDLAAASGHTPRHPAATVTYDGSAENPNPNVVMEGGEDLTIVRYRENRLSEVLQELKNIREDIERIYAHLPADVRQAPAGKTATAGNIATAVKTATPAEAAPAAQTASSRDTSGTQG